MTPKLTIGHSASLDNYLYNQLKDHLGELGTQLWEQLDDQLYYQLQDDD